MLLRLWLRLRLRGQLLLLLLLLGKWQLARGQQLHD